MRCAADPWRGAWAFALLLGIAACDGDDSPPAGDGATDDGGGTGDAADAGEGSEGDPPEWTSLEERPCPEDSFLTFENFGAIHLLDYCTGCHASGLPADQRQGSPIEINFDSLDDVRRLAPQIWARAADGNATMPPVGGAPPSERALLGEWLACGAPTDTDLAPE